MGSESLYSFSKTTRAGERRKYKHLKHVVDNILKGMPESPILLEAGSGRGEFAEIVSKRGVEYIGIEPSDLLREKLKDRGFSILAEPLPGIDLGGAAVDLVYSYDVVEHLSDYSTILKFFSEAYRVLKPGGRMIVVVPNAETIGHLFYLYEYQHSFYTSQDRIEAMLKDTGFEIIESRPFLMPIGLSENGIVRMVDRLIASSLLFFARNIAVTSLMKAILGRDLVFRIHKNLYDHIMVIGRKT